MKLLNIFKKESAKKATTLQKLEKKQLEKVIGGGDGTETTISATTTEPTRIYSPGQAHWGSAK